MRLKLLSLFVSSVWWISAKSAELEIPVRICAAGFDAYSRCLQLQSDIASDMSLLPTGKLRVSVPPETYIIELRCIPAFHIFECVNLLRRNFVDLVRMTAEQLYGISQEAAYSSIIPVAAAKTLERCHPSSKDCHLFVREYSVAVVRKLSNVKELDDLQDTKACFGNVSNVPGHPNTAMWMLPVYRLQTAVGSTNISTSTSLCPLDLTVVNNIFPSSCAPGLWVKDPVLSPLFSYRLCQSCLGEKDQCLPDVEENDPLTCLLNGKGDVAFISTSEVDEVFVSTASSNRYLIKRQAELNADDFQLLCRSGLRNIDEYETCHWGIVPQDVYVSNKDGILTPALTSEYIVKLFVRAKANKYSQLSFVGPVDAIAFSSLLSPQVAFETAIDYLKNKGGDTFLAAMSETIPTCGKRIRFCVHNALEMEKCMLMKVAFRAAGLPDAELLECPIGQSEDKCVAMLKSEQADVTMVASGRAKYYVTKKEVVQLFREVQGEERIYAVAVTSSSGPVRSLNDLGSGKVHVCSAGTDSFAGWAAPNSALKRLGIIDKNSCRLTEAWARLFPDSCVPGALSGNVTLGRYPNMTIEPSSVSTLCTACANLANGHCKTAPEAADRAHKSYDKYYGDLGALRCMIRRKGDVAFVRSTALQTAEMLKNLGDKDFKNVELSHLVLLCPDGTSSKSYSLLNVPSCNLGEQPERMMVGRASASAGELARWQDVWVLAQDRSLNYYNWFHTYIHLSFTGDSDYLLDLIFSNNTISLERLNYDDATVKTAEPSKEWLPPFQCRDFAVNAHVGTALPLLLALLLLTKYLV